MTHPGTNPATILVVDDDAAVRQVLGRVLARDGYTVLEAGDAARALQLTREHHPQLAVLDLCLADGDGAELAAQLHAYQANLPLILITGYPLRLHENPGLSRPFRRVLTKPVDVNELRLAVTAALTEGVMPTPNPSHVHDPIVSAPAPVGPGNGPVSPRSREKRAGLRSTAVVVLGLVVLAAFVVYVVGVPIPGLSANGAETVVAKEDRPQVAVVGPHTVAVPEDVRRSLGIRKGKEDRVVAAAVPTEARPLVLFGSTQLDPNRLMRLRARFAPAEVIKIGQTKEVGGSGPSKFRDLRPGDAVEKDQELAVFYSIDVGNKKNDLVDALVQLQLDEKILDASQKAYNKAALSLLDLLAAERAVNGDYNAINRAENTLRAWTIPEDDLDAVRKEAEEINKNGGKREKDPEKRRQQVDRWARVVLKAPDAGTLIERNFNEHEVVVENTLNLFQIARVARLQVIVNAPEDDLPRLDPLRARRWPWTIQTVGRPPEGIPGTIDDISYLIDVNQHSALVKGYIPNDTGLLRGGQLVTATIHLPPPQDVVEVRTDAVVDDGKQAVVFVEKEPGVYTLRRVDIAERFDNTVFVRSAFADGKDEQPLTREEKEQGLLPRHTLKPNERVITSGVLELKKELEDRESGSDAAP